MSSSSRNGFPKSLVNNDRARFVDEWTSVCGLLASCILSLLKGVERSCERTSAGVRVCDELDAGVGEAMVCRLWRMLIEVWTGRHVIGGFGLVSCHWLSLAKGIGKMSYLGDSI